MAFDIALPLTEEHRFRIYHARVETEKMLANELTRYSPEHQRADVIAEWRAHIVKLTTALEA